MEPPSSMPLSLSPSAPPVTKKEPLDLETLREDVLATLAQSLHQLVESDMIKFLEKIEEYKGVIADPEVASDIFKLLENMKKNISKFEASLANATIAKSNEEQSKNGFS
jgi:hypothetical protein